MEWINALNKSILYIEENLLKNISAFDVAKEVNYSPFYFQKGFRLLSGYTIYDYIKSRRLTLAGMDIVIGAEKIPEIAFKYGYESQESFTKAFKRFHGITPAQARTESFRLKTFLPLNLKLTIEGGDRLEYTIEKKPAMKLIGQSRTFTMETAYDGTEEFWWELYNKYTVKPAGWFRGQWNISKFFEWCKDPESCENEIVYFIAAPYSDFPGGEIPRDFEVMEIPEYTYAIFKAVGPPRGASTALIKRIYAEWLPFTEYEIDISFQAGYAPPEDSLSQTYTSEFWIPLKQ